ncbi:hypothetical protein CLS_02610 [[Clostridium] cf. saccharolyticum K10]|nr:hypothetical protein CLS_02610 [[Clostridium] cf. saccharolyticum K10]
MVNLLIVHAMLSILSQRKYFINYKSFNIFLKNFSL